MEISVPQGTLTSADGKVKLEWNDNFAPSINSCFEKAQKFVDSEVLRLDEPLMPLRTGFLIKSGQLGTIIGSGEVDYLAPYSAFQYYGTSLTRPYDSQRGGKWFERMKAANKETILGGARKLMAR
jgi:hypothetical protein